MNNIIIALQAAKSAARERIAEYLAITRGIDPEKPFRCLAPEHEDKHPSMRINPRTHRAKCFSCGASLDIFDVAAIDRPDLSSYDRFLYVYDLLGIAPNTRHHQMPDKAPTFAQTCNNTPEKMPDHAVLSAREAARREYANALPADFAHPYLVRKHLISIRGGIKQIGANLIVPRTDIRTGEIISAEIITPAGEKRQYRGTAPAEANASGYIIQAPHSAFSPSRWIIISEGAADAETIAAALNDDNGTALYHAVISTFGIAGLSRCASALADRYPDKAIYIAADNDEAGLRAAKESFRKGISRGVLIPPRDAKDWNAAYTEAIAELSPRYGPEAARDVALLTIQQNIIKQINKWEDWHNGKQAQNV